MNFFNQNIGVIARGPSVYRLDLCVRKFKCCFLAGEFNDTLDFISPFISKYSIVLCIMQEYRYRTTKERCNKYGIKHIQLRHPEGSDLLSKYRNKFSDLFVYGCNKWHYDLLEKIDSNNIIFSTGLAGIFFSLFFEPKNIYIIGIDFYDRTRKPYYRKEDHDLSYQKCAEESVKITRNNMIDMFYKMTNISQNTHFYIYTTYKKIKSKKNLSVKYV